METLNVQTHGIVVSPSRKRLFRMKSIMVLAILLIIGMDVFAIWAFWNHYGIDASAYVAAIVLPIGTLFMGWATFILLYRLRWRGSAIVINTQGLCVDFPLRFSFSPRGRQSFIPWEEIEWISSSGSGIYTTWLSISLKDPARYWSLYGRGKYRHWRRDSLTSAHINIFQSPLSLSSAQILQRIEECYNTELLKYEVMIKHGSQAVFLFPRISIFSFCRLMACRAV